MSDILDPYSVDESRPVDPVTLSILAAVNRVAVELSIPFIVVGATARDLLLYHVFGVPVTRATADVDFAFAVESWERFQELRACLLASGEFHEGRVEHRIHLSVPGHPERVPVDLIPFGAIAEDEKIHWPPQRDTVMTVVGFEDALRAAVPIRVSAELTVPIASLAAIAVLKVFAWRDRQTSDKDALDLYRLLSSYADAGNLDRLYVEETSLLEEAGFDIELAGAALLGADACRLSTPDTLERMRALLDEPGFLERLAEQIRISRHPLEPERVTHVLSILGRFADQIRPRAEDSKPESEPDSPVL